ncbi:MAG: restriction endonuclease subunit S [Verrucomicrobia bacterium]|nr:restriction endonuclease subunit S [Verrucomicrobiota bacterium]
MIAEASIDEIVTRSRWATTVGKVCDEFGGEVQTGPFGSQLHASDYSEDGTPVVMPQDMRDGKIICDHIARVGQRHVNQLQRHMLRVGDVVYSRRGDVTRFAVVTKAEEGWLCGTGSIRIRLNCPEIEVGYVRRYLQQELVGKWLKHHAKGVTMPNLNTNIIRALPFVYPPLAEQRRIAEVLDRAEALRTKRRAALAQLDTLTQSLFLDLFGDPMKNERGWMLLKVGVAGRVQLGRQRAPQYQSGKHTRPYVRVANVYEDRLALSDVLSMDFDREDFEAHRLEHGDILLNEGQSTELVGRTAMWRNEIPGCCFQNTLIRFQPNRETTLPEFALALFLHYYRSGEFAKISSKTSNVAHLGAGRFSAMPFPLPPITLQREFARRVTTAEALKAAHRASLAELDALFATLQHRAFRGEL